MFDQDAILMRTMSAAIQLTGWPKPEIARAQSQNLFRPQSFPAHTLDWVGCFYEIEQTVAARLDMSAVLNIVGGP